MRFKHERPADVGEIKAVYGQDPDGNLIAIQQTTATHDLKGMMNDDPEERDVSRSIFRPQHRRGGV
jgi:hypothetical protein